jgi:hypothetical protein
MGMPAFHKYYGEYNGEHFTISIGPIGIRRCKLCLWLAPYLYGSDIELEVSIKNKRSKAVPYEWRLSGRDGQQSWWVSQHKKGELLPNEKHKIVNVGNLFRIGQHSLQMRWGGDIANEKSYTQMAEFTLMDRDIHALKWALILVSGLVGLIIGLIPLIITWATSSF